MWFFDVCDEVDAGAVDFVVFELFLSKNAVVVESNGFVVVAAVENDNFAT